MFASVLQRTKTNIKIFSDPMPGSNERSIQLIGSNAQIVECVEHFLDDIGKVRKERSQVLHGTLLCGLGQCTVVVH